MICSDERSVNGHESFYIDNSIPIHRLTVHLTCIDLAPGVDEPGHRRLNFMFDFFATLHKLLVGGHAHLHLVVALRAKFSVTTTTHHERCHKTAETCIYDYIGHFWLWLGLEASLGVPEITFLALST
jgi:hypothetical protein